MWSIPGSILIDWVGHYTRAWSYWDNPLFASTGINIFGIPLESFVWGSLFWIFYVVIYEYFFDKDRSSNFGKKEKFLALNFTIISLIIVFFINSHKPAIPFFYAIVLVLLLLITILFLLYKKALTKRIIYFGIVVFVLGLQIEYFSLKLNLWLFPEGDFIKIVNFFQHLIPIEEILWWLIVPMCLAVTHEIFADNQS